MLCEVLDVSDPTQVVPRVRALKEDGSDAGSEADPITDAFEEMQEQLESLRERNAELLEYLQSSGGAAPPPAEDEALHPDTEALLDELDAATLPEARERAESLTEQIDHLYHEKEKLAEAGLMSAEEALEEIDRLQKKCDRLSDRQPTSTPAPTGGNDILDRLNIDSLDDAATAVSLADEADAALAEVVEQFDMPTSPEADDGFLGTLRSLRTRATALRDEASTVAASTEVADVLGIDTVDDARELEQIVRRMTEKLDTLLDERETLRDELGVAGPDLLDLVGSLEQQLVEFYDAQSASSGERLAEQIEQILGISSVEEAHELESLVHRMNERLEAVSSAHEDLVEAGFNPQTALETINSMEDQLVSLYGEREEARSEPTSDDALVEAVSEILGVSTPEEVRQMNESVRRMSEHLDTLQTEYQVLAEAGLNAEDALLMLESMSDQLSSLYEARDERTEALLSQIDALSDRLGVTAPRAEAPEAALEHVLDEVEVLSTAAQSVLPDEQPDDLAGSIQILTTQASTNNASPEPSSNDQLAAIQDVLGISTVEEAKDLAAVAESMTEQLEFLYADREKLQEIGVTSVESAVDMVQNMSAQLDELYEEQEMLQGSPTPAETGQQDTFEQLASLYSEQEKLERALGISEADEIIEMVEALTAQLEDVYSDREASAPPKEAPAPVDALEEGSAPSETAPDRNGAEHNGSIRPAHLAQSPVFASMRDQLESLYEEKEALLNMGIDDARAAAGRIDELEARLSTLQHEHEQCRSRLEHLHDELGTTEVEEIVEMIGTAPSDGDAVRIASGPASSSTESSPAAADEETPVVLPRETLDELDSLSEEALDDLSVGALRLDDDGEIEYLNEAALDLPGLDTVPDRAELLGEFFFKVVPSSSNTLFLNRFRSGVEQEQLDARFPYTFVSPQHPPTAFYVHLYRAGPSGANWILFRPAR